MVILDFSLFEQTNEYVVSFSLQNTTPSNIELIELDAQLPHLLFSAYKVSEQYNNSFSEMIDAGDIESLISQ